MKLRKYSCGSLIKNGIKIKRNISYKNTNNILLNQPITKFFLKLPNKKESKQHLRKRSITSNNLNLKENKNKYNHKVINLNNNSQKSLISKSNSDLRYKSEFILSPNCSMNIISKNNNYNKNKTTKRIFPKNLSSRNLNVRTKSFEILKTPNEDAFSDKNFRNKKFNDSLKANNKLKVFNIVKKKGSYNSLSRINIKACSKNKKNKVQKAMNNIFGLLSKKNKLKKQIINFSALFDKYFYDSMNINLYQSEKENININSNIINNNKYRKHLQISNNNIITCKNMRNINKGIYLDFQAKVTTNPKNLSKTRINLPLHPNSKNIKTETNQLKRCFSKTNINLTESNIRFDNKLLSRIKKEDLVKGFMPINLRKKNSYKNINIINNCGIKDFDFFSNKSLRKSKSKTNNKIYSNKEENLNYFSNNLNTYEGVEIGHFRIVQLIQANKKNILEKNE